ncbi:peptidoglycan DD-metalloendopeptidase family protein [Campylobacter sp.]|uniref:peptidoglycan DD-metalloendopeptidase family protein n=1 Tax=Campylobacter sp. TaxID=205 RepID=UPI002AA63628|nr:peptidoglycan DD-metalloendopeptidase family protein [Campylobacter sp.]MCI6662467.1 peptidoglycan DD-metalloendopeptidase family protein [Campylobacter sp.]
MSLRKNKFMITITDLNGSRNFVLGDVIKRIALYIVLVFVLIGALTTFYIRYLLETTNEAQELMSDLQRQNSMINEAKQASRLELERLEGKISELGEQYGVDLNASLENATFVQDIEKIMLSVAETKALFEGIPNGDPTGGKGRISDHYGYRTHPVLHHRQMHAGLDFAMPIGTPIYATANGVVLSVGIQPGYGHMVEIRHNFGFGTRYGHLNGKYAVKQGDFVRKGDIIAYSGNSGLSTGPHLHYEIRFISKPLNPINFVNWKQENYKDIFQKEGQIQWQSLVKLLTPQITNKAQ